MSSTSTGNKAEVYCCNCKHYYYDGLDDACHAPSNQIRLYSGRSRWMDRPEDINKHLNCKWFVQKVSLWKRLERWLKANWPSQKGTD